MSRRSAAVAVAAAYAALAVLVAAGAVSGADQWAVDHLMPGGPGTRPGPPTLADAAVPLLHASWTPVLDAVANIVTLPAQAVVASVLAAACCFVLGRRGRRQTALVWGVAWIVGNGIEVLCKSTLDRPLLHAGGVALTGLQSSYPSGHTLRSILLAALAATIWPAARRWAFLWAAATFVLLEVSGVHVPSDIAGGLLLAVLLILLAGEANRRRNPS